VKHTSSSTACRLYGVSTADSDSDGVWVTEIWESAEVHDASLKLPATRDLIAETTPLIGAPPEAAGNSSPWEPRVWEGALIVRRLVVCSYARGT
jgi:quinol monooxygenase YgiN